MAAATHNLSERVSSGEAAAVARAISKIEDGAKDSAARMKEIYQRSRGALVIGITGAPGAGKSSLVDKLAISADWQEPQSTQSRSWMQPVTPRS